MALSLAACSVLAMGTTAFAQEAPAHKAEVFQVGGIGVTIYEAEGVEVVCDNLQNAPAIAPFTLYYDGMIDFTYGQTTIGTDVEYTSLWGQTKVNKKVEVDTYVNISRDYYTKSIGGTKQSYSSGRVWDTDSGKYSGGVKVSSPYGYRSSSNKANFGWNDD